MEFPAHLFALNNLANLYLTCKEHEPDLEVPIQLPPNLQFRKQFSQGLPDNVERRFGAAFGFSHASMRTTATSTYELLKNEIKILNTFSLTNKVPPDIRELIDRGLIMESLSLDEFKFLIQWRRALDTLMIWKELNSKLNPGACSKEDGYFDTSAAYFEKAAKFQDWITDHIEELAKLPDINFHHHELPIELFIPSLIGNLPCSTSSCWQEATCKKAASYVGSPTLDLERFKKKLMDGALSNSTTSCDALALKKISPTCGQIRTLHVQLKARNTLDVWMRLCDQLKLEIPNSVNCLTSLPKIEEAAKFQDWIEAHRMELCQLESLDLSGLNLFSLPEEIGKLTGLKRLSLSNNKVLIAIPKQISDLPLLEELDLSYTGLDDLSETLSKFRRLRKLKISGLDQMHIIIRLIKVHNFTYNPKNDFYEKK